MTLRAIRLGFLLATGYLLAALNPRVPIFLAVLAVVVALDTVLARRT